MYQGLPRSGTTFQLMFEWALAMHWWGIDPRRFEEYDGDEMAYLIAVYRTAMQIESVQAWDQRRK